MTDRRTFMTQLGLAGGALAASLAVGEEATPPADTGKKLKVLLINGSPHLEGCTYTAPSP